MLGLSRRGLDFASLLTLLFLNAGLPIIVIFSVCLVVLLDSSISQMPFAYYNIYELVPNVRSTPSKRSLNDPDITDGALVILHHISS